MGMDRHLALEAVPDAREKKKRGKRVSKSVVGAERVVREKGVKIAKNREKGYPKSLYDQSSSHPAIIPGKGR